MKLADAVVTTFARNRFLFVVVSAAFFSAMIIAGAVTYFLLLSSPDLVQALVSSLQSLAGYIAMPPPYTGSFYRLIFLNNIGHFWNPIRLWVWIPLVGAFDLGYELLLNAALIGAVASFVSITKGPVYTTLGLLPHGVIEIPAFLLEFTALARWHIATTRAFYAKLSGQSVDRPLLLEGVKDTLILSLLSVLLFAVAAYIETFITPHLIGR